MRHGMHRALRRAWASLRHAGWLWRRVAPRRSLRVGIRLVLGMALGLAMAVGLGLGVLSWRLAQGPLQITWAEPTLRAGIDLGGDTHLRAEHVALAWDGWRNGGSGFPAIQLEQVSLNMPGLEGTARTVLVHLSMSALLRGELAPTLLEVTAPRVQLRAAVSAAMTDPATADADSLPNALRPWLAAPDEEKRHLAIRGLRVREGAIMLPANAQAPAMALEGITLEALRGRDGLRATGAARLEVAGIAIPITVEGQGAQGGGDLLLRAAGLRPDRLARDVAALAPLAGLDAEITISLGLRLDATLTPRGVTLEMESGPGSQAVAGASIAFLGGRLRAYLHPDQIELHQAHLLLAEGVALDGQGRAWREAGGWRAEAQTRLPELDLASLPGLWPEALAPQWRAQALQLLPVGRVREAEASVALTHGPDGIELTSAGLRLPLRDGRLGLGPGPAGLVFTEALLVAHGTPQAVMLEQARMVLPSPRPGQPASTLQASASLQRREAAWHASGELQLDQANLADLPSLWPEGVGGNSRHWLVQNITAGTARDGRWQAELLLPDGGAPQLLALSGRLRAEAATVHWLAPMPPVIGVSAEVVFSPDAVAVTTAGGRQTRADGSLTGIELPSGQMRFHDFSAAIQRAELNLQVAGSLVDMLEVLRHPRLRLFERRPLDLNLAAGSHATRLAIAFPLLADIPNDALRVRAESRLTGLRLLRVVLGRDLDQVQGDLVVDQDRLRVQGTANMLGAPLRLLTEMDFRAGPPSQIVSRESVQGTASVAQLAQLGFDLGDVLGGSIAIDARTERRRNGQATVQLRGDLAPASINLAAARWGKAVGSPGSAEALLRLQGDNLVAVENGRIDMLELALRGRAVINRGRIERYEIAESIFGGSRFQGDVRPPSQPGAPWQTSLRGPLLDLRPIFGEARRPAEDGPATGTNPPLVLEARFDRITMGDRRELFGVQGRAVVDEHSVLRQGFLRGRTAMAGGGFELAVAPRGGGRSLRITAENGGAVLRALDGITSLEGGRLAVEGGWAGNERNATLTATATLENFVVRGAPAIGKVLQAMTLYGLTDALQGGQGLTFVRAEIPFTLTREVLTLNDARAFSPSLGLTARGRVLREADIIDLEGTIVPAYIFNTLLGNLPVVGRLFSPEPGGGVFATAFRAQGAAADPQVQVNPLSTLTPGFLRGMFGLGQEPASTSPRVPGR